MHLVYLVPGFFGFANLGGLKHFAAACRSVTSGSGEGGRHGYIEARQLQARVPQAPRGRLVAAGSR
jgi:hypothetical protein